MRKLFFFSLLLLPYFLFSQNIDSTSTKKFSFGFIFSPDYCFRTIKSDGVPTDNYIVKTRDSLEIPKTGFTIGGILNYQCCKRFEIETGISFSDNGEKQKDLALVYAQPDPSFPTSFHLNYNYFYLNIPVNLKFFILKKKFGIYLAAGVSTNFYLKTKLKQTLNYADGYQKTTSASENNHLSRINPVYNFGIGFTYKINSKISIGLEPIYRRSIIPIIKAPIKQWNYSYGIVCGIYFACK